MIITQSGQRVKRIAPLRKTFRAKALAPWAGLTYSLTDRGRDMQRGMDMKRDMLEEQEAPPENISPPVYSDEEKPLARQTNVCYNADAGKASSVYPAEEVSSHGCSMREGTP